MTDDPKDRLIDAALDHVPFDGWSETSFRAAMADTGIDEALARGLFPRGAVDMALAFHTRGDVEMARRLRAIDLSALRIRDRITLAVRTRIEVVDPHKEAVRRGTTLFALPIHAADGARAVWNTCDAIWEALNDPSEDFNWYSKRATLSGVYSATILYWLGDSSEGHAATWAFLDRRIEDVMRIEKVKKQVNDSKILKPLMAGPNWVLSRIKAPAKMPRGTMPGHWAGPGPGETR